MNDNGSVFRRNDGRVCGKYKDADGKWRYVHRKTKTEAKQTLREALKELQEGKHEVSVRTLDNRKSIVRTHFQSHPIARTKLTQLDHDQLRSYMKSKNNLAASTRQKLLSVRKYVGTEGVRLRVLRHNPVAEYKPPREEKRELEILCPEQIKQLIKSVEGHRYELIVVLGAVCGVRAGEALGTSWEDIDFDRGTLEIKRTVWRGKPYPPKTRTSRRTLKLPQRALDALRRRCMTTGYLCPTYLGNPTDNANFHYHWKAIVENAGLPRETTFHSLRHASASILLSQNIPIPVVE